MKKSWRTRLFALPLVLRLSVAAPGLLSLCAFAAQPVTPLTFGVAIERGDIGLARDWLDAGLDPNFVGDRFGTGMMIAAWEGNLPMVQLFYERGGRVDYTNKNGEQPLQMAAYKGHTEIVLWLLDHGAPLNRQGKAWSALHYAVFNGQRDLARMLIQRGADVNARVPNEATALMLAAREGHEKIADDLIKAGADPSLVNDTGDTALSWAMKRGNPGIAKLVSSPEAFANAVRAQQMNPQPPPLRSVEAPSQIDDLLRRIRYAEAQNLPTAGLRKALATAVERERLAAQRQQAERQRQEAALARGMVVTADRKGPGEKVEVIYGTVPGVAKSSPTLGAKPDSGAASLRSVPAARGTPVAPTSEADQRIQALLVRIRTAKAKGEPTDELRKELMDAVSGYKP